ncbi:MAG: response regulator transcription factor, partial [Rickettsiales bacterium]|nr:response regulator transcription factor [Rickettsiales bacterium]
FIRRLRRAGVSSPAIILTAAGDTKCKLDGLSTGADDFLAKPFLPKELFLRIGIALRRKHGSASFGYDRENGFFHRGADFFKLSETEQKIMEYLLDKSGEAASRHDIADFLGSSVRSVDVWVARLRRKIETDPKMPVYITTVRNVGYRLKKQAV